MTKTRTRQAYERPEFTRVELTSVAGLAMACCKVLTPSR